MKRNHNYSSSESDLDDNVEVEKDSGDENGYVRFYLFHYWKPIYHRIISFKSIFVIAVKHIKQYICFVLMTML